MACSNIGQAIAIEQHMFEWSMFRRSCRVKSYSGCRDANKYLRLTDPQKLPLQNRVMFSTIFLTNQYWDLLYDLNVYCSVSQPFRAQGAPSEKMNKNSKFVGTIQFSTLNLTFGGKQVINARGAFVVHGSWSSSWQHWKGPLFKCLTKLLFRTLLYLQTVHIQHRQHIQPSEIPLQPF